MARVRVSITIIRAVLSRAGRYDLDREALLLASGLSPAALEDPTGRVPFEAAARMIELAIERVDTPSLGLQAGANLSAHAMHVVGALLQASGTLREAHTLIERFERLVYDGANHSLAVIDGGAHYRYIHAADTLAERFVVDLALAFTLRTVQHLLLRSDLEPSVARLTYARPDDAAEYEQVFGCPVEFGAEFNEFVIPAELLELPLMHSDARLAELLERRATELLAAIDGEADLTLRVREALETTADLREVDMDSVAARLGTSRRTLQRRLGDAGTSWKRLFEEEQKRRACAALLSGTHAIKELADELGFTETSAFHRAFRRWTGHTPADYRRTRRPSELPPK